MKNTSENNNLIYIILIVFIAFVFIIIAEVFFVRRINSKNKKDINSTFIYNTNDRYYDTSKVDAEEISLINKYDVKSCEEGCSLKYLNYYFIFKKDSKYELYIVDGNRLLKEIEIGNSIDNTHIFKYQDHIAISTIKINDSFKNDYVVLINENDLIDEYTSLESNEIEFKEEGIIYYYSNCNKQDNYNAYRIKALRKPFDKTIQELDKEEKIYQWCIN